MYFKKDILFLINFFFHSRTLGALIDFGTKKSSTCTSFVLEVGDEVCGIIIGCREGKEFYQYVYDSWLPEVNIYYNISLPPMSAEWPDKPSYLVTW